MKKRVKRRNCMDNWRLAKDLIFFFLLIYVAEWLCIKLVLGSFGTILVGLYRGGAARFWIDVHYCKWCKLF